MDMHSEKCQFKMKSYWWNSILWTYSRGTTADFSSLDFLEAEAGNQRSRCDFSSIIFKELKRLYPWFAECFFSPNVEEGCFYAVRYMGYITYTCMCSGTYVSLILTIMYMGTGHTAKQHSLLSFHFYLANNPSALVRMQKDTYLNRYRF